MTKRPAAGSLVLSPAAKKAKKVRPAASKLEFKTSTTQKSMKDMLENGTDQATLWRQLVDEYGNDYEALPPQVESNYHKACKAVFGE